jgi:sialidase-1
LGGVLAVTVTIGAAALLAGSGSTAGPAGSKPVTCTTSVPFTSGTEGYHTFRIPAVISTARGTLIAFAEGRGASSSDSGDIDVVSKRSTDGGCTWGPLSVVVDAGPDTAGNPSPVIDPATGRIVLVTCQNAGTVTETQILKGQVTADQSRRVFVQDSTDDGQSWSARREITGDVKLPNWRWYATGPGHAIALRTGVHKGRLVVASDHSVAPAAGSTDTGAEPQYYGGHGIYSDDGGQTWHLGWVDDTTDGYDNPNESTAAQLPDGRIYVNARDAGTAPGTRSDGYSADGGTTLVRPFRPQDTITTPVVQGSVLQLRGDHAPLLYSGPADPAVRAAMAIRVSTDQGVTWGAGHAISGLPAAYSDLVQLDDDTVGLLYETGDAGANDTITFTRVPLRGLLS